MEPLEPLMRWLLTYLLHSSLLLGAAVLVSTLLRERRLGLQEAVLRAALVGGLVTATLQVTLDLRPLGGALLLPGVRFEGAARHQPPAPAGAPARAVSVPTRTLAPVTDATRSLVPPAVPPEAHTAARERLSLAWPLIVGHWRLLAIGLWATLALWGLTRLGVAGLRLRALLDDRRPLRDLTLLPLAITLAETLGLRRPFRLSTTPRLTVPIATGLWRPEVCLPTRVLSDLAPDEQLALCAHELAHVARRDPAWLLVTRLVEALVPVQPLNGWARRRLQDIAECLSDDLAVVTSAQRLGLARSLVDVASWACHDRSVIPQTAPAAFGATSRLALRVERLMDPLRRLERPGRLLLPAAAAAVLVTALITPVVSGQGAAPSPRPAPKTKPALAADVPAPPAPPVAPIVAAPRPPVPPPPPTPPEPPAPPLGPADASRRAEIDQRIAELTRQIEERAYAREAEVLGLEAQVAALAAQLAPNEKDLERLQREIETTAAALADEQLATARRFEKGAARDAQIEARRGARERSQRLAELQRELRETVGKVRLPEDDVRALRDKARALAEAARPTATEIEELRGLAQELAQSALREIGPEAHDAARLAQEAAEQARETLGQVREELQRAREEVRRLHEEARRAAAEAARAAKP